MIRTEADLAELFEEPSLVEDLVDIDKELSVIVTKGKNGEIVCFDAVEMEFNPKANLVEFLFAPASISSDIAAKAQNLAIEVSKAFDIQGLLAVEMFVTPDGRILANEVAPRPHNSGHWTIEGAECSQFENHLRAVAGLPLGSTAKVGESAMLNFIGEVPAVDKVVAIGDCHLHHYGKAFKVGRKVGHATLRCHDMATLERKIAEVEALISN